MGRHTLRAQLLEAGALRIRACQDRRLRIACAIPRSVRRHGAERNLPDQSCPSRPAFEPERPSKGQAGAAGGNWRTVERTTRRCRICPEVLLWLQSRTDQERANAHADVCGPPAILLHDSAVRLV